MAAKAKIGNMFGLVSDKTYNNAKGLFINNLEETVDESMKLPGSFIMGTIHDIRTVVNPFNQLNYWFNPDESLEDITDYSTSAINVAKLVLGAKEFTKTKAFGKASVKLG